MTRGWYVKVTCEQMVIVREALDIYIEDLIENCPDDVEALEKATGLENELRGYQDIDARPV